VLAHFQEDPLIWYSAASSIPVCALGCCSTALLFDLYACSDLDCHGYPALLAADSSAREIRLSSSSRLRSPPTGQRTRASISRHCLVDRMVVSTHRYSL